MFVKFDVIMMALFLKFFLPFIVVVVLEQLVTSNNLKLSKRILFFSNSLFL